jgi:hypothetical protein
MTERDWDMKLCSLLGIVLLALAIASCGGGGDDDTAEVDASSLVGVDSAPGTPDAPPAVVPDAPVGAPDASTADPRAGVVTCGDTECDLTAGNVCCVSMSGSECTAAAECSGGFSAPQHCDGPEDCSASERCCAYAPILTSTPGAFCEATCETTPNGSHSDLCHDDGQCPGSEMSCGQCCFPGAEENPTSTCLSASQDYQYCPCAD